MPEPANPNAQPTNAPTNKTLAATGGSAVGAAIATIILYLIEKKSGKLPEAVTGAITILISAGVTFIAGYFTPHGANEGVVKDEGGKVVSAR
jgi:multisubunit Na+/H+ antiporter MnhB subunit